jgi:hypothetical protein
MQIVLEHVRVKGPNLTEIHCHRAETETLARVLEQLTGKRHLPVDYEDTYSVFITDQFNMEEAEALLIGVRRWSFALDDWTREQLQTVLKLERYLAFLAARHQVYNLERRAGLDSYDYADTESGE